MAAQGTTCKASKLAIVCKNLCTTLLLLGGASFFCAPGWSATQEQEPSSDGLQTDLETGQGDGFRWTAPASIGRVARRMQPEVVEVLRAARTWIGLDDNSALYEPFTLDWVVSREDLARALGRNRVPDWFAAVAIPSERRLVIATQIAGSEDRLRITLRHELMHLAMADLGMDTFRRLPSWFHEGCAQVFAGDVYLGDLGVTLSWRALSGSLESLKDFERGFGDDPYRAAVGYELSETYVNRLLLQYDDGILIRLIRRVREGKSLDAAHIDETGLSVISHENLMREDLQSLLTVAGDIYKQLFLALSLGLIVVFPFVRAARKRRRRALEEHWETVDEHPSPPMFENEPRHRQDPSGENV